jgi:hypothetical protein
MNKVKERRFVLIVWETTRLQTVSLNSNVKYAHADIILVFVE